LGLSGRRIAAFGLFRSAQTSSRPSPSTPSAPKGAGTHIRYSFCRWTETGSRPSRRSCSRSPRSFSRHSSCRPSGKPDGSARDGLDVEVCDLIYLEAPVAARGRSAMASSPRQSLGFSISWKAACARNVYRKIKKNLVTANVGGAAQMIGQTGTTESRDE